jgi:N-acetylglucosaminyldiphosphoundecaprenol N-acetyl-beta-D-mannosaminyltransferase
MTASSWPRKVDLFGVGVSVTTYDEATEVILGAVRRREPAVVACQAVHAVITASSDPILCRQVNSFELVTPDGQPVRWAMNLLYRTRLRGRVYGPELMLRVCRRLAEEKISIYLYGGSPAVIEKLRENLGRLCPDLVVAGYESPPFRPLTADEDRAVVERINGSGAGVVFLGLGCPKQDRFAYEHRSALKAVQVCVGAAFDFHAGVKKMAPAFMQRHGLEWLYRLAQEPRRLFHRYLTTNSLFLAKLAAALMDRPRRGARRSETSGASISS